MNLNWIMFSRAGLLPHSVFGIFLVLAPSVANSQGSDALELHLRSNQAEYVIGEPVKLTVGMANQSAMPLNVVELELLGMNMEFMYYEMTTPQKEMQHRRSHFVEYQWSPSSRYVGEILPPGDSIVVCLYPSKTNFIKVDDDDDVQRGAEDTFLTPGTYSVRLVYKVPSRCEKLWRGADSGIKSNVIKISFRQPDEVEREILNAYWSGAGLGTLVGEFNPHAEFNEAALRAVIEKHPAHPMTRYALYALGRARASILPGNVAPGAEEAVELLLLVRERFPDFRPEEVSFHLGTAYLYSGEARKAIEIYEANLATEADLRDQCQFMARYLYAKTGNHSAYGEWLKGRKHGQKLLPFESGE